MNTDLTRWQFAFTMVNGKPQLNAIWALFTNPVFVWGYATMFSGMYLAVVLLLAALIVRGVAFAYRGKRDAARWRHTGSFWNLLQPYASFTGISLVLICLLHGGFAFPPPRSPSRPASGRSSPTCTPT